MVRLISVLLTVTLAVLVGRRARQYRRKFWFVWFVIALMTTAMGGAVAFLLLEASQHRRESRMPVKSESQNR